ncbi:MAG: hypothetical protein Q4C54_00425 [Clostridia bacterium]|nr:hypothetical protein [Clostridia bacterium]
MKYCFQLLPHANTIYQKAQETLGQNELHHMLLSLGISAEVNVETKGGASFYCFETEALTPAQLCALCEHSSLLMMCQEENGLLRPIEASRRDYFPRELAELLKYKGKTSATFTRMMLNCAIAAATPVTGRPLTVLDPMCGRGTTLYCALERGCNAIGVDVDRVDLREAINYMERYLTRAKMKYKFVQNSLTGPKGGIPHAQFTLADTKEHYLADDVRTLRLLQGDSGAACGVLKKTPADVIVCDLPYGIQHASMDGRKPENPAQVATRVLPAWKNALRKGGAMAISFNALTLKRAALEKILTDLGLDVLPDGPFGSSEHYLEQAVTRDFIVARK